MKGKLTAEQLELIKLVRQMEKKPTDDEDGTLATAKRLADEFTESYGIKAMVIRRKNFYFWVSEYFFDTYEYSGKIYHTTKVELDAEV